MQFPLTGREEQSLQDLTILLSSFFGHSHLSDSLTACCRRSFFRPQRILLYKLRVHPGWKDNLFSEKFSLRGGRIRG